MNNLHALAQRYAYRTTIAGHLFSLSQNEYGTITVTGRLSQMPKNWNSVGSISVSGEVWIDVFSEQQLLDLEKHNPEGWQTLAARHGFFPPFATRHTAPLS